MRKNIFYAFIAQILSLLVSVVMLLVVSKIIDIKMYSYWQLFIMYSQYVMIAQIGISEGVYLRTKAFDIRKVNKDLIRFQYFALVCFQFIFALIMLISLLSMKSQIDKERFMVFIYTIVYMVVFNICYFCRLFYQTVNMTRIYSLAVIIEKIIYLIILLTFSIINIQRVEMYMLFYCIVMAISLAFCIFIGKDTLLGKIRFKKEHLVELKNNIISGLSLLLSNISGGLVLVAARIISDMRWGIIVFGKFSMAISLSNFFLSFINQISMVLFPFLKTLNSDDMKNKYDFIRKVLFLFAPSIFLVYVPFKAVFELWLPQYSDSIKYLILTLPICMFDGKMQVLCNTFLKVLRKERFMLCINLTAVVLCAIFSLMGAYVFNNVYFLVFAMVMVVVLRSLIAEIYIGRFMNNFSGFYICTELILTIIFICATWFLPSLYAFLVYMISYILHLFVNRKNVSSLFK